MYRPATTNRFDKDLKRTAKRGKDLTKIRAVMISLAAGEALPEKYKDHSLIGNYTKRRECHIEPDWLLIYKLDADEMIITFERTGSHSDLF
jgi:mRNA interferase YafQ